MNKIKFYKKKLHKKDILKSFMFIIFYLVLRQKINDPLGKKSKTD